jgi:uncharacterized membrane protein (DUF2068 family)
MLSRTANKGMVFRLGGLGEVQTTADRQTLQCYETFHKALDFVTMHAVEKGYEIWHMELVRKSWQAIVYAVMNLRFLYGAGNFLNSRGPFSYSERTLLRGVSLIS